MGISNSWWKHKRLDPPLGKRSHGWLGRPDLQQELPGTPLWSCHGCRHRWPWIWHRSGRPWHTHNRCRSPSRGHKLPHHSGNRDKQEVCVCVYERRLLSAGTWLVSYLHACVIEGDEGAEQIQVACGEHNCKQDLALSRDTFHKHIKHIHQ